MTIDTNAILKTIEAMGYTGDDLIIRQAFMVNKAADEAYHDALARCDATEAQQANFLRRASCKILARYGHVGKGAE